MSEQLPCVVRLVVLQDVEDLVAIEQSCHGEHAFNDKEIIAMIRYRNTIALCAESKVNGVINGFMIYQILPKFINLVCITIDREFWRMRIGEQLMMKLKEKVTKQRSKIECEVLEDNLPALMFFRKQGFLAVKMINHTDGSQRGKTSIELQYDPSGGKFALHNRIKEGLRSGVFRTG